MYFTSRLVFFMKKDVSNTSVDCSELMLVFTRLQFCTIKPASPAYRFLHSARKIVG
jgi:hypothetical protein